MFGIGPTELLFLTPFLLFILAPGVLSAFLAGGKGRTRLGWFVIGVVFPPAILALLFLKPATEVIGKWRECPTCREYIKWNASMCRYCQTAIAERK